MCQMTPHFQSSCYPKGLIDSTISSFIFRNASAGTEERNSDDSRTIRISLPFKVKWTLMQFGSICAILVIRFTLRCSLFLWARNLKHKEFKPPIVNRQCVVYRFSCDPCDAHCVGYTARHLHQRIAEHKYSASGRHFVEAHGSNHLLKENQFRVLIRYQEKFNRLVFEMLFIKNLKINLNIQTDSIRVKLFNYYCSFLTVELFMTHCYFGMYRLQLAIFFFWLDNDVYPTS